MQQHLKSFPNILKLNCRNFRSYRTLLLSFSSRFVVFYGENGSGKTNILEAISLFSSDRGLRKAPLAHLNSISASPFSWNLELVIENNKYKTFLSTGVQNTRRIAKIDNAQVASLAKMEEVLWMLWIIPSMDNIFIDQASERRSFFDHLVSGYDKKHKQRLKKLNTLQKERLHIIFNRKDETWLRILEEKIAGESIQIVKSRQEFIDVLNKTFEENSSDFLRPKVTVSGIIESIMETNDEENAALEIAIMLKNNRFIDSEKQTTSISVHKSIWNALHPISLLNAENCSTGEQKAFIISLVLAASRIYQNSRAGIPILLLDDIMVHLDKNRRKSLINEIKSINIQTLFTGTEAYFFEEIKDLAQFYHVEKSICSERSAVFSE